MQEGVLGTGTTAQDYMVQQRTLGANMSVEIVAPANGNGGALVQGDSVGGQGLYYVHQASAAINELIAAADPSNPRLDSVILRVQDDVHDGGAFAQAVVQVLTGTPNGATTMSNRVGAASVPASSLLLADVLVGAAASSITNSAIRDRRKWARGAFARVTDTTSDITLSTLAGVGSTYRLECSGTPMRVVIEGLFNTSAALQLSTALFMDGSSVATPHLSKAYAGPAALNGLNFHSEWVFTPAAGSHTFQLAAGQSGATVTLKRVANSALNYTFEEIVRQDALNNLVTSG